MWTWYEKEYILLEFCFVIFLFRNILGPCSPGSFSTTGLSNCRFCSKGYYQPVSFGKQCLKCPGSTTTKGDGAAKLSECGSKFLKF